MNRVISGNKIQDENVFNNGCLIHLRCRCWGGYAKISNQYISDELPKEMVRAVADLLIDKSKLDKAHQLRNEAHRFIDGHSLPFPVDGLKFIPKKSIETVNAGLESRKESFKDAVEDFVANLESLIQQTKTDAPAIYQKDKYPSTDLMLSKFGFDWTFRVFNVPELSSSILPPELYKQEMDKAKAEIDEMKNMAVSAIGRQFLDKISALKEQCSGTKSINTATVESLHKFLDKFDESWGDFFCHDRMRAMINECKGYMIGADADMLRHDAHFREVIGSAMGDIVSEFEKIGLKRPERKMDI